jgi:hypothetical protein
MGDDYWQLLPITPDVAIRKIVKDNLTVGSIIKEWRSKWQTSNRWTLAEVDQLISDMENENGGVRFQAVVVCSRAVERIQTIVDKLSNIFLSVSLLLFYYQKLVELLVRVLNRSEIIDLLSVSENIDKLLSFLVTLLTVLFK